MPTFGRASDARGRVTGENKPPGPAQITTTDPTDALNAQQGHGICKGLSTSWVIAFLNGEAATRDPALFPGWFTGIAKFQGTYVKDFGGHIPKHIQAFEGAGVLTGVQVEREAEVAALATGHFPDNNPWAAYCSCWHHDIAFGANRRAYYIMEPNRGLFVYDDDSAFVADVNDYMSARRASKGLGAGAGFRVWYCTGGWVTV